MEYVCVMRRYADLGVHVVLRHFGINLGNFEEVSHTRCEYRDFNQGSEYKFRDLIVNSVALEYGI